MNGYWTVPVHEKEQEILGSLVGSNAVNFFERLAEMQINAQVATFMPKQTREEFYAGRCVLIVRRPGIVALINIEMFKKGLTPPPDKT